MFTRTLTIQIRRVSSSFSPRVTVCLLLSYWFRPGCSQSFWWIWSSQLDFCGQTETEDLQRKLAWWDHSQEGNLCVCVCLQSHCSFVSGSDVGIVLFTPRRLTARFQPHTVSDCVQLCCSLSSGGAGEEEFGCKRRAQQQNNGGQRSAHTKTKLHNAPYCQKGYLQKTDLLQHQEASISLII